MFSAPSDTRKDIYFRNRYVVDVQKAKELNDKRPKIVEIPKVSLLKKRHYLFDHGNRYRGWWEVFVIVIACVNCF